MFNHKDGISAIFYRNYEMKNNRDIFCIIVFVLGIVLINHCMSFLLVPHVSYARQVLHDITETDASYDVICFGSSESLYAFDSPRASEMLHQPCYNMGTSGTTLNGGVYATFQDVLEYQSPEKVIVILGRLSLVEGSSETAVAYAGLSPYLCSLQSKWNYYWRLAFDGGEVGRLFPWSVYHVDTFEGVMDNIQIKTSRLYREYDPSVLPDESLVYKGKGFCAQLPGNDNNNVIKYQKLRLDEYIDSKTGSFIKNEALMQEEQIETLENMIEYCQDSDIDIIIAMAPITKIGIIKFEVYDSYVQQLTKLCMDKQALFVDLNYAKRPLYDPNPYEYVDDSHVLINGATRYTEALCKYIQMTDEGVDTSDLFYQSWDEFIASVDWEQYERLD